MPASTLHISRTVSSDTYEPTKNKGGIKYFFAKLKAKRQVSRIIRSLDEAKKIHTGKKQAKTFDEFLDEL